MDYFKADNLIVYAQISDIIAATLSRFSPTERMPRFSNWTAVIQFSVDKNES